MQSKMEPTQICCGNKGFLEIDLHEGFLLAKHKRTFPNEINLESELELKETCKAKWNQHKFAVETIRNQKDTCKAKWNQQRFAVETI